MIKPLPYWVVPNTLPGFYETEGATAIQMVARIYGKIQDLIEDYNKFVDQVNQHIEEYETNINQSFECFKNRMIQTMNDYIETIDNKINIQDDKIAEAIEYMKDNIVATTTNIINQAIENGDIEVALNYNAETEALSIVITNGGE